MKWDPILSEARATAAWDAVHQIAKRISSTQTPISDLALFWAYASPALNTKEAELQYERVLALLEHEITHSLPALELFGAMGRGLSIPWVTAHLVDADDVLAVLDESFIIALESLAHWSGPYDLISGLVGIGIYFLERLPHPNAVDGLRFVLRHLDRLHETASDGVTWFSRPELLQLGGRPRDTLKHGCYDCGMAHGVAGVVGLLARVTKLGIKDVWRLCEAGSRWLEAQVHTHEGMRGFPALVANNLKFPSRVAWCYGTPGVGLALQRAAIATDQNPQIIQELLVECLSVPLQRSGVTEASFCHGASGLVHIANRFYQLTRDARFRDAAQRWADQLLLYHASTTRTDLLQGDVGIGLVLLAALTSDAPTWDRVLLCDL